MPARITQTLVTAFISDLGLQNLSRWNDQGHKLTGVMHSKVVCLLHQHLADCQSSITVAAPFGQAHVSLKNVQLCLLLSRCAH